MADTAPTDLAGIEAATGRLIRRRIAMTIGLTVATLAYLVHAFFAFDVPGLIERAKWERSGIIAGDMTGHKIHVIRDNQKGGIRVAIEGQRTSTFAAGAEPEWSRIDGDSAEIDLGDGFSAVIAGDVTRLTVPDFGTLTVTRSAREITLALPEGKPAPDWVSASRNRVDLRPDSDRRLVVTKRETTVFRRFWGWETFLFPLQSRFFDRSWGELWHLATVAPPLEEGRTNIGLMLRDFWKNDVWHHGEVVFAILETVLMAFLGTFTAALLALPLAFLSASNFTPSWLAGFGLKRVFDFLRSTDNLIWSILLSRAFGPGPMTGALAIALTDTGSFGKLYAEAMENVDEKQVEGVRSTGASTLQRHRFGVIPQLMPVLLSQTLYYLESNTRSATVVGAIVGGGIGLMLVQAINTYQDWEDVTYYTLLIILIVIAMDNFSAWARRRLIKGKA